MTPRELASKIRSALAGRTAVRLLVLYGSSARGTAGPSSDVDVAFEGDADPDALASELSRITGREVDVIALEDAGYPLLKNILRDGIVVHEAKRGAGAAWRAGALSMLETDRPWFERMRNAWLRKVAREGIVDG